MFVRKKKYPSGRIGIIVAEKRNGKTHELFTIGSVPAGESDAQLVYEAKKWISRESERSEVSYPDFSRNTQALTFWLLLGHKCRGRVARPKSDRKKNQQIFLKR